LENKTEIAQRDIVPAVLSWALGSRPGATTVNKVQFIISEEIVNLTGPEFAFSPFIHELII
jgi:hypothetical protein